MMQIAEEINNIVTELVDKGYLKADDIFVIGCSTSVVDGEQIGTSSNDEIAKYLYKGFASLKKQMNIHLAFQGCEHINRSLVIERATLEKFNLDEVTVMPVRAAGGSMASYAYEHMTDAVVTESIQADAGIDIGDTLIGMHLKHVAIPIRFKQKTIGQARVTAARTRPKLIGGVRAKYPET